MPAESVKERMIGITDGLTKKELQLLVASLVDGLQVIMAKLDADTGVGDTNYAATFANYIVD
jgi:hypothetical protein